MKLQAPQGTTGELHLNGRAFVIDKNGQVDVPDELISHSVWEKGYTVVDHKEQVAIEQPKQKVDASVNGKEKANV
jgi:hypothetical protein